MSKKNKVSSKKSAPKAAERKAVKKTAPKTAKAAVKKPAPKAISSKKPLSKSAPKTVKASPKKPAPVKKTIAKPVKKAVKVNPPSATKKVDVKGKKVDQKSKSLPASKPAAKTPTKVVPQKPVPKVLESKTKLSSPPSAPKKEVVKEMPAPAKSPKSDENPKKVAAEKKANEVLAITNTIPVAPKHEISQSKIASISQSITNPIRRSDSYAVKVEREPNGKFELEFVFHASAEMLYEFVSTASGLSEWFCDDLNIRNGIYTFIWDDQLQQARLLKTIDLQLVRFQWVEKTDGSYFEFRIQKDDLTNDIALIVTDFAESNSERESAKLLWNSQIEKLRHVLGSIF
jgi:uncharacterized protein YndB with AHSA1/START domain